MRPSASGASELTEVIVHLQPSVYAMKSRPVLLSGVVQPSRRTTLQALVLGAGWLTSPILRAAPTRSVRVAAASDLKFALARLLANFQKATGILVEVNFGASGNLARQIRQGLPIDLFMSADEAWVEQLVVAGLSRRLPNGTHDRGALYAQGRIALFLPKNSAIQPDEQLAGLRASWRLVEKFAIANPEHAPYGRAAREALQRLGLWEMVRPKLVLGENIAQTTQFVATGAAQAGITALSLALAPEVAQFGKHGVLPAELHAPLRQRMVLLGQASPQAQRLYDYLLSPDARELLHFYGFDN